MFLAVITDGRLKLADPNKFRSYLEMNEGKPVVIMAKPTKRTIPQNDRFHGVVNYIAKREDNDPEAVKELFKAKFGVTGWKKAFGKENVFYRKSTAKYTKEEMGDMMEKIAAWHQEFFGFPLPPDEEMFGMEE